MAKLLGVDIAKLVNDAMGKILYKGTLTIVTLTTRTVGDPTGGFASTTVDYAIRGFADVYRCKFGYRDLTREADTTILILGKALPAGVEPKPGDRITLTGDPLLGSRIATICEDGVERDPAGASWVCHCET